MPAPYITKTLWPDFIHNTVTHTFNHLGEISLTVKDSNSLDRKVIVTFTDHVFTRDPTASDNAKLAFPKCSRTPYGLFCPTRYAFSLQLPAVIPLVVSAKIWCLTGADRYAQIPIVLQNGEEHLYAIIFTLDKIKGMPFDLHMQVRSAYPCTVKVPDTFGEVRFNHLAKLRVDNKHPKKVFSANRKVPKLPNNAAKP